jgi:hypothetical protein
LQLNLILTYFLLSSVSPPVAAFAFAAASEETHDADNTDDMASKVILERNSSESSKFSLKRRSMHETRKKSM